MKKRTIQFILTVFAINWSMAILFALLGAAENKTLMLILATLYMLVPAGVSLFLIKKVHREALADYGFRFRLNFFWLLAWLVPVAVIGLTILLNFILGIGSYDPGFTAFFEELQMTMGEEAFEKTAESLGGTKIAPLLIFLQGLLMGTTLNALFGFGEELGWRGYLQKTLAPLGFLKSSALIGAVWGIWHAPIILMGHNFPETPWAGVVVMTAACIPLGILFSWVREKSGSVIAVSISHGVFNALAGYPILLFAGSINILKSPLGLSGTIGMLFLALFALLSMRKVK